MFELHEVWRNCNERSEAFSKCVRVFKADDVKISTTLSRSEHAAYWDREFEKVDALIHAQRLVSKLGDELLADYLRLKQYASKVGDILTVINRTLQPQDIENLESHYLDELDKSSDP
jgi:hypothetical protein